MASSGVEYPTASAPRYASGNGNSDTEKIALGRQDSQIESLAMVGETDGTHRKLKARHIQLIGIGGTIGTALYVQIGSALLDGGPGSLFIAFSLWCTVILAVTMCMAEMVSYLPISSPFIRFAGRYVDEALGFAAGWNFFVFEAMLVPFEVTACNVVIHFWSDIVPAGAIIAIVIVLYALINLLAVEWYGETEFWAALGKVLLIVGLIVFTFVVMLGGNPLHDRFGFRYWYEPGSFAEYYTTGSLGRFQGFMQCLIRAAFTIAGPDYVSMAAGEAENPRVVMPKAFNAVFYRLTTFFMLGSLCVGILVPYNDAELTRAFADSAPGAAASPYVVAMDRLKIPVLPHIVNAMVLTAAFSAGNSYVYCASRSLYGLALEGKAPKFFTRCTSKGVPIYCVTLVLLIALLAFLQVSENAAVVLNWFVSLVTASQLINYGVMCVTYICFYRALDAQGISRDSLPYKGFLQPYAAYYALFATFVMTFIGGYTVFLPGKWDVPNFLFSYIMVGVCPVLFVGWKLVHKSRRRRPYEVDLLRDVAAVEDYTNKFVPQPPR
ncbi:amino acid permease/ SLC12A domain-containing protein [Daldinia sp. FL1419]|nr:amino acid permease/ SLC12A domain-containing protein [Daldinia sp. FL1419]